MYIAIPQELYSFHKNSLAFFAVILQIWLGIQRVIILIWESVRFVAGLCYIMLELYMLFKIITFAP